MAQITLTVGGVNYPLACRDGEEAHLERLGEILNRKAQEAAGAVGNGGETRQLLLAGLLLADEWLELSEKQPVAAPPPAPIADPAPLRELAERLESLASRLENRAASA
jgi:cell division protein ZapA